MVDMMKMSVNSHHSILIMLFLCFILLGSSVALANQFSYTNAKVYSTENAPKLFAVDEAWVDDNYYNGSTNDGHTWGIDAFDDIPPALENITNGGIIHVRAGEYSPFTIQYRSDITLESIDSSPATIRGGQQIWDETASTPQYINCVIFVNNSEDIDITGFDIHGQGLTGKSNAVYYNGSSGTISLCSIVPNQHGNMNSLGIRAQYHSVVTVDSCVIEKYGRVGIYCRTGTTITINNNTLIGTVYTDGDGDFVNYGIEIEDLSYPSHATITQNEIFNHDHIGNPTWSSAAIIVDSWRYYMETADKSSAIIEYNDIHDNMVGLQIVPNEDIHVHRNEIYDNTRWGAISDPYKVGSVYKTYDLDAINNWWGHQTGPYHVTQNPSGAGNEITDNVTFSPWVVGLLPQINITRPLDWFLYIDFLDIFELKIPFLTNLIIGKIRVEAECHNSLYEINKVEFYVDNELKSTDTSAPYSWLWDEQTMLFLYKIKVKSYDVQGNIGEDDIIVWKIF